LFRIGERRAVQVAIAPSEQSRVKPDAIVAAIHSGCLQDAAKNSSLKQVEVEIPVSLVSLAEDFKGWTTLEVDRTNGADELLHRWIGALRHPINGALREVNAGEVAGPLRDPIVTNQEELGIAGDGMNGRFDCRRLGFAESRNHCLANRQKRVDGTSGQEEQGS